MTEDDVLRLRRERNERMSRIGFLAMNKSVLAMERRKLTPYVRQKAAQALRESSGDREVAEKLLLKWSKKDDTLWRQLVEPQFGRGYRPGLLGTAISDAQESVDHDDTTNTHE